MQADSFAIRLSLSLKALNLTRAHLAAAVGVDKSVVSRWLSGQAMPSSINVARISETLARAKPGFNAIAWDLPAPEFEALLGIPATAIRLAPAKPGFHPPDPPPGGTDPLSVAVRSFQSATDAARRELGRRGDAYDGFWEMLRPAYMIPGKFVRDQTIIHQRDGLLHIRNGGQGFEFTGWLLMIQTQIYGLLSDRRDDSLVFIILNGVNMPRVEATNGLVMAVTSDRFQTPTASPVYCRRVGDLSGDDAKDRETYDARRSSLPNQLDASEIGADIRALLLPDVGPRAFESGGELLMRAMFNPAYSHGTTAKLTE